MVERSSAGCVELCVVSRRKLYLLSKESACSAEDKEWRSDPWVRKIPLEEEMATDCSILAWEIPWTEEPGGLQSNGSQRVG